MDYNANALSTDPLTGNVLSVYWSLRLTVGASTAQRTGIVNVASLPPFANEAAAIQAAKDTLGPAFIAALEAEVLAAVTAAENPPSMAYPFVPPPAPPLFPPLPPTPPPPDPPIVPPFVPL
jgi:hypothetical protein